MLKFREIWASVLQKNEIKNLANLHPLDTQLLNSFPPSTSPHQQHSEHFYCKLYGMATVGRFSFKSQVLNYLSMTWPRSCLYQTTNDVYEFYIFTAGCGFGFFIIMSYCHVMTVVASLSMCPGSAAPASWLSTSLSSSPSLMGGMTGCCRVSFLPGTAECPDTFRVITSLSLPNHYPLTIIMPSSWITDRKDANNSYFDHFYVPFLSVFLQTTVSSTPEQYCQLSQKKLH